MKSDLQIAQEAQLKPITEIAASIGIGDYQDARALSRRAARRSRPAVPCAGAVSARPAAGAPVQDRVPSGRTRTGATRLGDPMAELPTIELDVLAVASAYPDPPFEVLHEGPSQALHQY